MVGWVKLNVKFEWCYFLVIGFSLMIKLNRFVYKELIFDVILCFNIEWIFYIKWVVIFCD